MSFGNSSDCRCWVKRTRRCSAVSTAHPERDQACCLIGKDLRLKCIGDHGKRGVMFNDANVLCPNPSDAQTFFDTAVRLRCAVSDKFCGVPVFVHMTLSDPPTSSKN